MVRVAQPAEIAPEPNKAGYYLIRYHDGVRTRYFSSKQRTREGAQAVLDRLGGEPLEHMIDKALDRYSDFRLAKLPEKSRGRTSVTAHVNNLRKGFGRVLVDGLTQAVIDDYVVKRRTGKIGRPSVDGTIRTELKMLMSALRRSIKRAGGKATDLPDFDLPNESPPRQRWLTDTEINALLDTALVHQARDGRLPRIYRFCALALFTAARKTALETLKWSQVDLDLGLIHLKPENIAETSKRRPTVPISDDLMPILKRAKIEAQSRWVLDHPGTIIQSFDAVCRKAGVARCTPHTLRHTWATRAAQKGVSMFDIAGMLGDTIQTVSRNYAHHSPQHLRAAANFWSS